MGFTLCPHGTFPLFEEELLGAKHRSRAHDPKVTDYLLLMCETQSSKKPDTTVTRHTTKCWLQGGRNIRNSERAAFTSALVNP
jgi:hypothetical protein